MSTMTRSAAEAERMTAIHARWNVRILSIYVKTAKRDDISTGFPASGDMLATIRRGTRAAIRQRRRRHGRYLAALEATDDLA